MVLDEVLSHYAGQDKENFHVLQVLMASTLYRSIMKSQYSTRLEHSVQNSKQFKGVRFQHFQYHVTTFPGKFVKYTMKFNLLQLKCGNWKEIFLFEIKVSHIIQKINSWGKIISSDYIRKVLVNHKNKSPLELEQHPFENIKHFIYTKCVWRRTETSSLKIEMKII